MQRSDCLEDGVNIDNWHFDELSEAIREFKCIQNGETYEPKPISQLKSEGSTRVSDADYDEAQIEEIKVPLKEMKVHIDAKKLEESDALSPWF